MHGFRTWWRERRRLTKVGLVAGSALLLLVALASRSEPETDSDIASHAAVTAGVEGVATEAPSPTARKKQTGPTTAAAPATTAKETGPTTAATTTTAPAKPKPRSYLVRDVVDGDTITLANGWRVRLVQIDSPELGEAECYARDARAELVRLLPARKVRVRLEFDPNLDREDRYGRKLAYVIKNGENVNRTMVLRGAAAPWFYEGDRGRHAEALLSAAQSAKENGRGLWSACPGTALDPENGVETREPEPESEGAAPGGNCDPSYPDFCITPPPPDLDCKDIGRAFSVQGDDPHRFDRERDGVGCESYG